MENLQPGLTNAYIVTSRIVKAETIHYYATFVQHFNYYIPWHFAMEIWYTEMLKYSIKIMIEYCS